MPAETDDAHTLKGFAGAAGRVEGIVRVLDAPEDGDSLRRGNFSDFDNQCRLDPAFSKSGRYHNGRRRPFVPRGDRCRELGIPAVVGCGNATSKLKTGTGWPLTAGKALSSWNRGRLRSLLKRKMVN